MEVFKKLLLFIQTKLVSINGDMQKLNNHFSDSDWQDIIVNSPNVGTMLLGNYRKKNGIATVTMQSQEVGYELPTSLHNTTPVTNLPASYRPEETFTFSFHAENMDSGEYLTGYGRIDRTGNVYLAAKESTDVWECSTSFPVKE